MASLSGKRIFYIEDDINNRAIATMILQRSGVKVGFERWGANEVISRIRAFMPIDLILCDLMFPNNVTGFDVFDRIHQEPDLANIPILAISSSDPTLVMPKVREKGFVGFISKPINFVEFAHQIAQVIDGVPIWVAR